MDILQNISSLVVKNVVYVVISVLEAIIFLCRTGVGGNSFSAVSVYLRYSLNNVQHSFEMTSEDLVSFENNMYSHNRHKHLRDKWKFLLYKMCKSLYSPSENVFITITNDRMTEV